VQIIRDINFDAYLDVAERARVRPASEWANDVVDSFHLPRVNMETELPWEKTSDKVRLRYGELSIWSGMNYEGKSLMLSQVMLGCAKQGDKVCIASLEMKPVAQLRRMTMQAVGVATPSIEYIRRFHKWTDGRMWLYDQFGSVQPRRIFGLARYCATELGIKHLVVDSLMKCGVSAKDLDEQKNFVNELHTIAGDTGMSIHLVAHARKPEDSFKGGDRYSVKGASEITDMADNVMLVWRNRKKEMLMAGTKEVSDDVRKEADAMLVCDKQRHGSWDGKFKFWFHAPSQQYLGRDSGIAMNMLLSELEEVVL
jgi:twinkle protein